MMIASTTCLLRPFDRHENLQFTPDCGSLFLAHYSPAPIGTTGGICITNDDICITNDEFCINNDDRYDWWKDPVRFSMDES